MSTDSNLCSHWLALDVGNSRIKWGLWKRSTHANENGVWQSRGAFATNDAIHAAKVLPDLPDNTQLVICNVAGTTVGRALRECFDLYGMNVVEITSTTRALGMSNQYEHPERLGADRFVALAAAHKQHACNQLVVLAGTALTVDCLTEQGEFIGGVISPGLTLMRESLHRGTAQLPMVYTEPVEFPIRTESALATGTMHALFGPVERMRQAMLSVNKSPMRIVVAGGNATLIATMFPGLAQIRETLILDGLIELALANRS